MKRGKTILENGSQNSNQPNSNHREDIQCDMGLSEDLNGMPKISKLAINTTNLVHSPSDMTPNHF